MQLTKFQLLNITTGVLHTKMEDIYDFFNQTIEDGIMTHMLPRALRAIQPILKRHFPDFPFEGYFPDYEHKDDFVDFNLSPEEKAEFFEAYAAQPNPLDGKEIIVVKV